MEITAKSSLSALGVTEEVFEKLTKYVDLIRQWNKAINLVAPSTIGDIWERHILDSAQLWPVVKNLRQDTDLRLIDLGSGGGLPGLVLAMMGAAHVTLVESDTRKCVFMREVSRETSLKNVTIINERIEKIVGIQAPIITARALAPLAQLIEWASPLLEKDGHLVFLKGQDIAREMAELPDRTRNKSLLIDSITDKNARIIVM